MEAERPERDAMDHEHFMRRAIGLSREKMGLREGGPFACVIVYDGEVVGEGWNRVTSSNDPTAHAEVEAIRAACDRLGTYSLSGAVLYASCEPCPMCLAAIHWARIDRIFYANTTQDAASIGFDDAALYREIGLPSGERQLRAERLLADEAHAVFDEWDELPDKTMY
jgi:tRNA(Arg) A34 adenosine deaminase TadA